MTTAMRNAVVLAISAVLLAASSSVFAGTAYLEVTLQLDPQDRAAATALYRKYRPHFLAAIPGARSMLIRQHDVQVLHGFATEKQAQDYLASGAFAADVVMPLRPLLKAEPRVRLYSTP